MSITERVQISYHLWMAWPQERRLLVIIWGVAMLGFGTGMMYGAFLAENISLLTFAIMLVLWATVQAIMIGINKRQNEQWEKQLHAICVEIEKEHKEVAEICAQIEKDRKEIHELNMLMKPTRGSA